jgi:hypothetical protein
MPNKKIRGGFALANVVPGGMTPQGMSNSITAGIPANSSSSGSHSTCKGGRQFGGRRSSRKGGRRSTRKGGRRSSRKGGRRSSRRGGGGVLATAALPFGLFGLQRLFGKRFTRKLRNMF